MSVRKIISLSCTLLFVYFAAVQYNDPDPHIWVPTYLLAAGACLAIYLNKAPNVYVYWVMAAAYLIAAVFQWPPEYEGIFFGEMEMRSLNIELARESLGLAISAVLMFVMARLR